MRGRRVGDSYLLRRPHGSVPVHVTARSRCGDDDGSVVSSGSRVFEEPEQKTDTWSLVQGTGSGLTPGKRYLCCRLPRVCSDSCVACSL